MESLPFLAYDPLRWLESDLSPPRTSRCRPRLVHDGFAGDLQPQPTSGAARSRARGRD